MDEDDKKNFLPLVDFHTHIGKVRIQTTSGTSQRVNNPKDILALYSKLQFEIHKRIEQDPDAYYITLPPETECAKPLYPFVKDLLDIKKGKTRGWLVDHVVSFPFNDIFHKSTEPKFIKSNRYVRSQIFSMDYSFRFIPFCRVDPRDKGSENEVRESIRQGMRGLKLHPMSQGWIEEITSAETKEILKAAGDLGIPTIFDVPNKKVAQDITYVSDIARKEVEYPIYVVLGHSAFDYSSPEVFECLNNQEMLVETSGMRGKDVEIFFRNVMQIENWYSKIVFGSDHNYFSVLQAADFITFLLSKKFSQLFQENKTTIDLLNAAALILGGNALRIIPSASYKKISSPKSNLDRNPRLTSDFSSIYSVLNKHMSKDNCYATIEMGFPDELPGFVQIVTIGRSGMKKSFKILKRRHEQNVIFSAIKNATTFEANKARHFENPQLQDFICRNEVIKARRRSRYDSFTDASLSKFFIDEQ
ncbi:MAG: amidohydrolase family protein [Candidatus Thorarchaeota archaeon]